LKQIFEWLFGTGPDLEVWQMVARAAAVFFVALVLIRASGRRSFGQHSPFDACITVLLGAVLSRAVVGASPFWSTIAAGAALVIAHRMVALGSARWAAFEDVVSGCEITLVRDGHLDRAAMRKALVSRQNLEAAIRQKLGDAELSSVRLALLERDGKITVVGIAGS